MQPQVEVKMKKIVSLLIAVVFALGAVAQKKAIAQARTYIKSGKELEKAEKLMRDLLKDSANRNNPKIWVALGDAVRMQYDKGNEKLYLKQKYDTAALFNNAKKLFLVYEAFDSIDAKPDKKGKVQLKYRSRHAQILNGMRPNLYNGASFFLRKHDYANAWDYYDMYIQCAQHPLFQEYSYADNDTLMTTAAYRALYSAYRLHDMDKTYKYLSLAEKDTAQLDNTWRYLAETQLLSNDTTAYVATLKRGFERYPAHTFFFPRLVDYYNMNQLADSADTIINDALATDSTNVLFLFAKSTALLNAQKYDDCIAMTQKLMQLNDSMPEAYCNMGLAYYNQALLEDTTGKRTRKKRQAVNALYEKSRPYLEKYRELAPQQQAKWVPALYTIYLNLNMGKQFEEIDNIRAAMSK